MTLEKLQRKASKNAGRFITVAKIVVDSEVSNTTDENMKMIARFTAYEMAMGEILTRRRYVGLGFVFGVAVAMNTRRIWDRVEERRLDKVANDYVAEQEAKEASEEQGD